MAAALWTANSAPFCEQLKGNQMLPSVLLLTSPLSPPRAALLENGREHSREISDSRALGYAAPAYDDTFSRSVRTQRMEVCERHLGFGPHSPFASDECGAYVTEEPIAALEDLIAVRHEAAVMIADATGGSTFTMRATNRDVALHEMRGACAWFNRVALPRLASLAVKCFPSSVSHPAELYVYRGLVIQYDAEAELTHQPLHRDGCSLSCIVSLSERHEYEGGGTYLEPLGTPIAPPLGHALVHPGALRHAGHRITAGERCALLLPPSEPAPTLRRRLATHPHARGDPNPGGCWWSS